MDFEGSFYLECQTRVRVVRFLRTMLNGCIEKIKSNAEILIRIGSVVEEILENPCMNGSNLNVRYLKRKRKKQDV